MKKVSHCTELLALGVNEQTIQFLRTPPPRLELEKDIFLWASMGICLSSLTSSNPCVDQE